MPTTLPMRKTIDPQVDHHADFARAISLFYALLAVPITTLVLLEFRIGMFTGLTLFESVLRATGAAFPYSDPGLIGMF